jgi:hypothetical protein
MLPPLLDQHFGLLQRVEDLAVEQLITQFAVEQFHAVVRPRAVGLDE